MVEKLAKMAGTRVYWESLEKTSPLYTSYREILLRSSLVLQNGEICEASDCENTATTELIITPLGLKDLKGVEHSLEKLDSASRLVAEAFRKRVRICIYCAFKGIL